MKVFKIVNFQVSSVVGVGILFTYIEDKELFQSTRVKLFDQFYCSKFYFVNIFYCNFDIELISCVYDEECVFERVSEREREKECVCVC